MDILKSKLDFKSGKQLLIIVASLVAALVTIYVAYTSIARRNISLSNPDSNIGAANPSCLLNLSLNRPSPSPTPIACVDATDIALVIDRSSTMTDKEADGRTKLAWAKEAAVAFVDAVAASGKTNIRISVSSFGRQGNTGTRVDTADYDSTLDINLTNNYTAVKSAINGIVYKHSGTCIQCGLRIGNDTLLNPSTTHPKFTILLSDGMANHVWDGTTANAKTLAIAEANTGRAAGIVYYAIGYGTGTQISPSTLISIAGTSANYVYKPNVTDWSGAFVSLLSNICTVPGSTSTPIPTATKTPSPKPAATKTPTPKPTATPTKSPTPSPVAACTNWGVDENSGSRSTLIKINSALSTVTTAKNYPCSSGYCEFESMDYDRTTKSLYIVPNVAPTKGLYKVNTSNGDLSLYKSFSPSFDVNGLAFKDADASKVWLWRNGYGLYTMNMSTGATTQEFSYTTYNNFESIVWDNESRYMYASRGKELWKYDPLATTNKFVRYATNLPGKTDALDFGPSNYMGGMLIGYSENGSRFFTYDVITKAVVTQYASVGINGDAFAACIPN